MAKARGWRIQRRSAVENLQAYRLGTVVGGLFLLTIILSLSVQGGASAFFAVLWDGTLGSRMGVQNIIGATLPLLMLGLAVAIPFRMGLWNLGAEGQLLIGAWAATGIAFSVTGVSTWFLIPMMMVAAAIGGAVWMAVPALARAYLGVNEIITTLLLNFVAIYWMTYWATGSWGEASTAGGVRSRMIPDELKFADFSVGGVMVPIGLLIAIVLALAVAYWLHVSRFGFESRVVGWSPRAGRYAGMSVKRKIAVMMIVGGAIAGFAGSIQLMDVTYRYSISLSENVGYTAVVVAVLAAGSATGVIFMAALMGLVSAGTDSLLVYGVPSDALFAIFGLILLLGATGDAIARFRLVRLRTEDPTAAGSPPTVPQSVEPAPELLGSDTPNPANGGDAR